MRLRHRARGRLRPRALVALVRQALGDSLHRSSLLLLANTAVLAGFGFLFWALAAHFYPASTIGPFAALIAGTSLLTAIATLGLPNMLLQQLAQTDQRRELILAATGGIAALGTLLCVVTLVMIGPLLPAELHLGATGLRAVIVALLVLCTAVSGATDAGLIALRGAAQVLTTNLAASAVKVTLLIPLTTLGRSGLLIAYAAGAVIQASSSFAVLWLRAGRSPRRGSIRAVLRAESGFSAGNYVAGILGILPDTMFLFVVLYALGPRAAAWAAAASLFGVVVNFVPGNTAQALYAELRLGERAPQELIRSALKGIYALTLPIVAFLVISAPLLLHVAFGARYAAHASGMLRILALSGLITGMTYVIDTFVLSRRHLLAYVVYNAVNAVLVLGLAALLSTGGLTAVGLGWTLGQLATVLAGLALLRMLGYRPSLDDLPGARALRARLRLALRTPR